MPAKYTKKQFIEKARKVHGDKYGYAKVDVSLNPVTIYCRTCKTYFQQGRSTHIRGRNCPVCAKNNRKRIMSGSLDTFIKSARKVHGKKFDYTNAIYINSYTKLSIRCVKCKTIFQQTPNRHITGKCGCRNCLDLSKATPLKKFIARAREVHGDKYDYANTVYSSIKKNIEVYCNSCETAFTRKAQVFIRGAGCPNTECQNYKRSGYSQMCIQWLKYEASLRKINILHAENGGEYRIPGTRFFVDGFCAEENTVFEFHGNRYHGNPKVYKSSDRPNPYKPDATAKQLFKETRKREETIKELGYNLVVMWESDWAHLKLNKANL